ncbi:MAG: DUF6879 family protein [Pseudonocardiales bacterium]
MALTKLNADSFGGGSPTVWRANLVTLQVQGWRTENLGIEVPTGEEVVMLPALLAVDAVAALDGDSMHFIDLMRMLRVFAASAFRLETRQSYADDGEAAAFREWREHGHVPDSTGPLIAEWTGLVRAHVDRGAIMRRVHVVSRPLTDYVRFELALQQAHSVPAGERVRVVDAGLHPELARADDFWLLDDRVGVRLSYDDAGKLTRLRRMTTAEVDLARGVRDVAWAAGTDLGEIDVVAAA